MSTIRIPWRLHDWRKVKKTGRGYTRRELTVTRLLTELGQRGGAATMLNVGFHDYQDVRNRWWIDICRANGIDWYILEIFEPNVQRFREQAPAADHHRIVHGDLKDIASLFAEPFDIILHWHGPEHLPRQDFLDCLPDIQQRTAKLLILGCPNGPEEQGQAYGNPHEQHISFWSEDDFHQLGFATERVDDKAPGHITAHRFIS